MNSTGLEEEMKMKRVLKIIGWILGSLLLVLVVGTVALYLFTGGDYSVPATVTADAGLPSTEILGVKLHAETFGDPQNRALIVLHGGPGGDYQSLMALRELSDRYYVVFYDQRGAGLSERVPMDQLTVDNYLRELDAIVDTYGHGDPVILAGHSWGAMLLSAYLGYAPEKVDKAILAEPGFLNYDEMQDWMAYQMKFYQSIEYLWLAARSGFEAQHVKGADEEAGNDYLYGQIVHYFTNHPENPYHCPGQAFDGPMWRFGARASQATASVTPEEVNLLQAGASVYENPVLFLAGECDTWIGPDLQAKHTAMYANARLSVIANAGHDMFWDNPEDTIQEIRMFLEE